MSMTNRVSPNLGSATTGSTHAGRATACTATPCEPPPGAEPLLVAVARLSNAELLARITQLAAREQEATAALIAHLAELDARRLYLAEGYSSLFVCCTQVLHLAEHAAYGRNEARGPHGGSRLCWSCWPGGR